jgi:large subunit ribosomal protein L25
VALPEFLTVDISHLQLGQAIHVSEMKLPDGAVAVTPGSVVVVQVVSPTDQSEEAASGAVEPELIRKEKPEAESKG